MGTGSSSVLGEARSKVQMFGHDVINFFTADNEQSVWLCNVCERRNKLADAVCWACMQPRGTDKNVKWTCGMCTFQNHPELPTCETCGSQKNQRPRTAGRGRRMVQRQSSVQGWHCPRCTFVNHDLSSKVCDICHEARESNPRPGLQRQESVLLKSVSERVVREANERTGNFDWNHIVAFCKENKEPFVDDSFPPAPKSLYCNPKAEASKDPVRWCRPSEIMTDNVVRRGFGMRPAVKWEIFKDPQPSDISQGTLGNCWFLSGLAVVAERPELLKCILITKNFCKEGAYLVRLCQDGRWTTVLIDDLLPCDKHGRLQYSKAQRNQLWVPLIEKAVAKLYGCYGALKGGQCLEGLAVLTGHPCTCMHLQQSQQAEVDIDLTWALMLSSKESGFLMGASCGVQGVTEDQYDAVGLMSHHAYSVLDVKHVNGEHRLVRLRNPWGSTSWKGAWADGAPQWGGVNTQLRTQMQPGKARDGVFWISFEDLVQYFSRVDVCKVREGWEESRIPLTIPNAASRAERHVTMVTVLEPSEVEIQLFQQSDRGRGEHDPELTDLCVAVYDSHLAQAGHSTPLGALVTSSERRQKPFVGCSHFMKPGIYAIVCMAFSKWTHEEPCSTDVQLVVHAAKPVVVEKIPAPRGYLARAVYHLARCKGRPHQLNDSAVAYELSKSHAGITFVVENHDPEFFLQMEVRAEGSLNMCSSRGALEVKSAVPPSRSQVVMVMSQVVPQAGYSIHYSLRYVHVPYHRLTQPAVDPPVQDTDELHYSMKMY